MDDLRWSRVMGALTALAFLGGCTVGYDAADGAGRVDDAEVVTLVPDSTVTIGEMSGEEPYLLSGVTDATRLAAGGIVIGDCQSSELRFFDAEGRHERTVGGEGDGPGEFIWLKRVFPASGDSVGVLDPFNGRVTLVAPDGRGVRTVRLEGRLEVKGRFSDGSFLVERRAPSPSEEGPDTTEFTLLRVAEDGAVLDSVPGLLGRAVTVERVFEGGPIQGHWLPLGPGPVLAAGDDAVYYGRQDGAGILVFDAQLELVDTVHTVTRPEPVTEQLQATWHEMRESRELVPGGSVAGAIYSETFADSMPAYGDIVAGRDGRLWVQDPYRMRTYPLVWTAYEEGVPVAKAELPPRFFPFEFGRDWVLGITYDELRVERVHLIELVEGELPRLALTPRQGQAPTSMPRCGPWAGR